MSRYLGIVSVLFVFSFALRAQTVIVQWSFNGTSDTTVPGGATLPSPSIGSGLAFLTGGTTAVFDSGVGSTDVQPKPPNYSWKTADYPAAGIGSKTAGIVIQVSTSGFKSLVLVFDQRLSNTSANTWVVQYTDDFSVASPIWSDAKTFTFTPAPSGTGDTWYNQRTADLSAVTTLEDNPNAAFRILSAFDPVANDYLAATSTSSYKTTGNSRFDMVTVTGIPINIVANAAPVASEIKFRGIVAVGDSLIASYKYSDAEGDPEATSIYQWYRADDDLGTNETLIPGADTLVYIPTADDLLKYLTFKVKPIAQTGTTAGLQERSPYRGSVQQFGDPSVLKINEVFSRGSTTNSNPDLKADWIEFYNSGADPVTLAALRICDSGQCETFNTDNYNDLIVPPGGFLALAEDDAASFTFGLSSQGEFVLIRDPKGALIDSLAFPALEDSVSFGRYQDGAANPVKLFPPTRGATNNTASEYHEPVVVPPITGIAEGIEEIQVFPSPTKGDVIINVPDGRSIRSITVMTVAGSELLRSEPCSSSTKLSLAEAARGLYVLRVVLSDGGCTSRKIVRE